MAKFPRICRTSFILSDLKIINKESLNGDLTHTASSQHPTKKTISTDKQISGRTLFSAQLF